MVNPFDGPIACVPDFPAIPTRRVRVFSRGSFVTGTSGIGFIVATPEFAIAKNANSAYMTTSTFAGNSITLDNTVAGVSTSVTNSDYTAAAFSADADGAQFRVVGSGLRVRYSGTELNRGGQIFALQEPTHDSLDGETITDFMAQVAARKFSMKSSEWTTICYRTVEGTGSFSSTAPPTGGTQPKGTYPKANYLGFLVQAPAAATSISLEYEFYTVFELTGKTITGIQASHVDIAGYAAVHTTASNGTLGHPVQVPRKKHEETFLQEIGHYLLQGLTWVGDHAGEIASVVSTVASFL